MQNQQIISDFKKLISRMGIREMTDLLKEVAQERQRVSIIEHRIKGAYPEGLPFKYTVEESHCECESTKRTQTTYITIQFEDCRPFLLRFIYIQDSRFWRGTNFTLHMDNNQISFERTDQIERNVELLIANFHSCFPERMTTVARVHILSLLLRSCYIKAETPLQTTLPPPPIHPAQKRIQSV
jgi:hypothetical protein